MTSSPSFDDFLNYNEDSSSWRYSLLSASELDPLAGVSTVSDGSQYPSYVNADYVHVSPVFKSDVSDLGSNRVNAKGWRRGLIAFRIIGVGADPDGPGSVLPNLIIEVVSPADINVSSLDVRSTGIAYLVQ